MLGIPSTMAADTNGSYALMNPYYGVFGQDTWHVTRNLTVTLGLRVEYEQGPTERYNRILTYFDKTIALPIAAAAQAAYAANPLPELPASAFVVQGGSVYAGANGASVPAAYCTATRPARAPNTRHSVSEFEPSRLAPFSDTHAASPAA